MTRKKLSLMFLIFTVLSSLLITPSYAASSYSFGSISPYGLAYHDGYVYTASRGTNLIARVSLTTGVVETVAQTGSSPMAVAVNSEGDVFYTRDSNTSVYKIPASSLTDLPAEGVAASESQTFATLSATFLYGMAFDANDNLYVSSVSTKTIYRLDSSGTATTVMSSLPTSMYGIGFDPDGNLYLSGGTYLLYKINQSDFEANLETGLEIDLTKLETVQSLSNRYYGIVFLPDGNMYVQSGYSIAPLAMPNKDIASAVALLPSTLTASVDAYSNLLTYLQQLDGMGDTEVELTLVSSNENITNDGDIAYTDADVTGDVIVHVNKINGTESTKTIAVTVLALPTVENAVYSAASDTSITLNWNNPSVSTSGTKIVTGTDETIVPESLETYTFTDLVPNTEYHFTLYALYENEAQSAGVAVTASTLTPTLTSVSADPGSISLQVGDTASSVIHAAYTDGSSIEVTEDVEWTSEDPDIASVSDKGVITGVSKGSTVVLGEVSGKTAYISVTVTTAPPTVSSVTADPGSLDLLVGGTASSVITATYSDGAEINVTDYVDWSSENPEIATVSDDGVVTGVSEGATTVTGAVYGHTVYIPVTVASVSPTLISVSASFDSVNLRVGISASSAVTATYSDGSQADVTDNVVWSSDNPSVTAVSDAGVITGIKKGSTTVLGTVYGYTIRISVTVKAKSSSSNDDDDDDDQSSNSSSSDNNADTEDVTNSSVFNDSTVHSDEDVLNHLKSMAQEESTIASFSDVNQHWANATISIFNKLHITTGYPDGSFRPDAPITRAEFAVWIDRVFNISADGTNQVVLNDISNHWAKSTINKLASSGVLNGYGTSFRPDQSITRAEMVAIISRIVNTSEIASNGTSVIFSDIGNSFASEQITAAAHAGIINGKGGSKFDPDAASTRAEALTVLLNALKLDPDIKAFIEELQ